WLSTRSSCHGLKKSTNYPPASAAPTVSEAPANEPMLPRMPLITHDLPRIRKLPLPLVASRKRHQKRATNLCGPNSKYRNAQHEQTKTTTTKPTQKVGEK